jgi:predicted lipoprotein with Yx(FWY)xxD motif
MKRKITMFIAVAAPLAAVLIAAGCGSSTSGSSYSVSPYGSAAAARASVRSATGTTKVGVASSRLGRIVVDGRGRTLYAFAKDKNGRSACTGTCATYWPPLLTSGKVRAGHGVKASLLGTTRRGNGKLQVTYNRHPLYTFTLDKQAGQTNGEGLDDFGGVWDVLSPAGKRIASGG